MKIDGIFIMLLALILTTSNSYAQSNTAKVISNKNYMLTESYSNRSYACSLMFKKKYKDSLTMVLNTYFEDVEISKNKIVWKKLRDVKNPKDIFHVELNRKSLKIEWENDIDKSNNDIIEKLKKINTEIINIIK